MTALVRKAWTQLLFAPLLALLLAGCAPLIGPYSATAYQNATSLKATSLALMDKSKTDTYASRQKEVESLFVEVDKAYEFVKGVPANSISARQWDVLRKPDGELLGKFALRWKERGTLGPAFADEFKGVIGDAYDEIICLEANKKEAKTCSEKGGK